MANYKKHDPRLESLVVETRTLWDSEISELSDDDKQWLSKAVHRRPELASQIQYERSHTGFTRQITVAVTDIERLYDDRFAD